MAPWTASSSRGNEHHRPHDVLRVGLGAGVGTAGDAALDQPVSAGAAGGDGAAEEILRDEVAHGDGHGRLPACLRQRALPVRYPTLAWPRSPLLTTLAGLTVM